MFINNVAPKNRPQSAVYSYAWKLQLCSVKLCLHKSPVAKFLVSDWADIVDYATGLSYWPTRLHWLAGRYDNPMPESTIFPQSGTRNSASGQNIFCCMAFDNAYQPTEQMYFVCRLYPSPPNRHCSVWLLPVISLLLTNTIPPERACLSIWLERFRRSQKEKKRPCIFNSSMVRREGERESKRI